MRNKFTFPHNCEMCGALLRQKHAEIVLHTPIKHDEMAFKVCAACITPLVEKAFDFIGKVAHGDAVMEGYKGC